MNKNFVIAGVIIMMTVAVMVVGIPGDLTARQIFGLVVLFIIGLGLTVAGSEEPKKKDRLH